LSAWPLAALLGYVLASAVDAERGRSLRGVDCRTPYATGKADKLKS
jgi:hypothetical protein